MLTAISSLTCACSIEVTCSTGRCALCIAYNKWRCRDVFKLAGSMNRRNCNLPSIYSKVKFNPKNIRFCAAVRCTLYTVQDLLIVKLIW
jgi:hypothetical protein